MTTDVCSCNMQGRYTPSMCSIHGKPAAELRELVQRRALLTRAKEKLAWCLGTHRKDNELIVDAMSDMLTALEMVQLHDESIASMVRSMHKIAEQGARLIKLYEAAPMPSYVVARVDTKPARPQPSFNGRELVRIKNVSVQWPTITAGMRGIVRAIDTASGLLTLTIPGHGTNYVAKVDDVELIRPALKPRDRIRVIDGMHKGVDGTVLERDEMTATGVYLWRVSLDGIRVTLTREDYLGPIPAPAFGETTFVDHVPHVTAEEARRILHGDYRSISMGFDPGAGDDRCVAVTRQGERIINIEEIERDGHDD